jgi:hypothetical protein
MKYNPDAPIAERIERLGNRIELMKTDTRCTAAWILDEIDMFVTGLVDGWGDKAEKEFYKQKAERDKQDDERVRNIRCSQGICQR